MDARLQAILEDCVRRGASDLHLSSEAAAYMRIAGDLRPVSSGSISRAQAEEMIISLLSAGQEELLKATHSADVGFSIKRAARFRGHVFHEQQGLSLAARKLEDGFRSLEQLSLPPELADLARLPDGLVLFTGPTGSGKSTTLATLIDQINRERACHILTIEDPIEYLHTNKCSLVHQRELYRHVASFAEAVRASLREDPDVVLVGEMRDPDTMRAAITVAETGHLVFSTLHCGSAVGALDRIIGAFNSAERESLCQQLSMTLRAVVAQHLLPRTGGKGLIPAVELLKVTKAVANLIRNHKSEQIYTTMESGAEHGMQTLEQSLAKLLSREVITMDTARSVAGNPKALEQRMKLTNRSFNREL